MVNKIFINSILQFEVGEKVFHVQRTSAREGIVYEVHMNNGIVSHYVLDYSVNEVPTGVRSGLIPAANVKKTPSGGARRRKASRKASRKGSRKSRRNHRS